MKKLFILLTILGFTQFSCTRSNPAAPPPNSLAGSWRMVLVTDNATGLATSKPVSIQGEVDIVFEASGATNGSFTGKTPTNDIWQSDYQTAGGQALSIPFLSMTKVMETSWGNEFVNNIRSSQSYQFASADRLLIKTTSKILTFRKR